MTTRRETTVTVTLPTGQKIGRAPRADRRFSGVAHAGGRHVRSFRRNGTIPKIEIHDPLAAHRNLLAIYTDKNIHDVTAFLAGVK
jgi:hypothetical protein